MADTEDLASVTQLLIQYCDLIDCGDLAGCAALFEKGAWGIVGTLAHGVEEVSAQLDNVTLYDGRPNTRHLMSNVAINIDPSGQTATAKSCITVMQHVPDDFEMQAIFIGTYNDRFAKDGDAWRFVERAITPDLIGDMSRHRADMN